jgi:hypothetical protein
MVEVRKKITVEKTEDGYLYALLGSEDHGRPSFRLWINRAFKDRLRKDKNFYGAEIDVLPFPIENARVVLTEKGNKVLRPAEEWVTLLLYVPCGYRGDSKITPELPEEAVVLPFYEYASERGSLGVSEGLLISTPVSAFPFKVSWERTGRTYGNPTEGVALITIDGEVVEQPPEDVRDLV